MCLRVLHFGLLVPLPLALYSLVDRFAYREIPPNSLSIEFTLCAKPKIEKALKFEVAPIHPPSRCPYDPFNWYQSLGSLFGLYRLREYG